MSKQISTQQTTTAGNYRRSKFKSTMSDCLNYPINEDKKPIRKKTPFYKDSNDKEFIPKFNNPNKNKLQTYSCFGNEHLKKINDYSIKKDKSNSHIVDGDSNISILIKGNPIKSNNKNETSHIKYNILNNTPNKSELKFNKTITSPYKTKEIRKHPTQSNIFNDKEKTNLNNNYIHIKSNNLKGMYLQKNNKKMNIISNKPIEDKRIFMKLNSNLQKESVEEEENKKERRSKSAFNTKIESLSKSRIFNHEDNSSIYSPNKETELKSYTITVEKDYDVHNIKKEFLKSGLHIVNMKPNYNILNNSNNNSISFSLRKIKSKTKLNDQVLDSVIRKVFDKTEKLKENHIKTYFPKPLCPLFSKSKSISNIKLTNTADKLKNKVIQHSLTYKNLHVQSQISTKSNSKFSFNNSFNLKKSYSIKSK